MGKWIKFALRRNLIYPLQLIIWQLLRKIETIIIGHFFNFNDSLFYTPLMFLGEFISGLIFFLYQKNFLKEKKVAPKIFSINLIYNKENMVSPDSDKKIFVLLFFGAFFDGIQFLIWTVNVPKFIGISGSIVSRLSGILAISSAILYYFVLRLQIFKHQLFSLIASGICAIIVIATEFIFQDINIFLSYGNFVLVVILAIISQILSAFLDSTEKYLFEIDFINPFFALMFEGLFGFIMSFLYFLIPGYLEDIKHAYKTFSTGELVGFTLLLFLYIILCGGRNVYRVVTNKLYSPMTRALTDYFLNPLFIIYDFSVGNDFLKNGERNIAYFIINLIISFVISICGCVYNEFMILFCCELERNTHELVSRRASTVYELDTINKEFEIED